MPIVKHIRMSAGRERGLTLLETIVALGIMAAIAVVFLGGIIGSTKAASISDEKATAESLAESQMEWVQNATYSTLGYTPAAVPPTADYAGYSVNIDAASLYSPDNGIQKITVTIFRSGSQVYDLEGYKSNR